MWSRLKKKKSFLDDGGAQAPAVSSPIIHLSLEKDLFVGAKKSSVVALEVPKVGVETVDLELQWEISVRHATLGFSATFIHDCSSTDRSATRALETNIKIGNNEDSEDEVDLTASTTGDFEDEDNIHILRESVLSQVRDPSGYLSSDLNIKRFLDARPGE